MEGLASASVPRKATGGSVIVEKLRVLYVKAKVANKTLSKICFYVEVSTFQQYKCQEFIKKTFTEALAFYEYLPGAKWGKRGLFKHPKNLMVFFRMRKFRTTQLR